MVPDHAYKRMPKRMPSGSSGRWVLVTATSRLYVHDHNATMVARVVLVLQNHSIMSAQQYRYLSAQTEPRARDQNTHLSGTWLLLLGTRPAMCGRRSSQYVAGSSVLSQLATNNTELGGKQKCKEMCQTPFT